MPGGRVLVIACGALARELRAVLDHNGLADIDVECLPAILHNRPERIPAEMRRRIRRARQRYDFIFAGYADCGTGGLLDVVLAEEGIDRLPGAHCYEFFAGASAYSRLQDEEPGTFYLTDYLTRHFDRLVWRGLGLDRHPELRNQYFGNYTRLVYLSQAWDQTLLDRAREAADRLGLAFEHRPVGYGELEPALIALGGER
jgi:hypothetical protein